MCCSKCGKINDLIVKAKADEAIAAARLKELLGRKEVIEEEEKKSPAKKVLLIIGAVTVVAAIAYVAYKLLKPDYLDDFDDDFEDELEDEEAEESEE